jgi:ATP-dependent Clp protease ATP-binding subunit ClpA
VLTKDEAEGDAAREKIGFEFVEGPVTPQPEKLPVARKRKPKPSGPDGGGGPNGGGGPKGPASKGPLVKV